MANQAEDLFGAAPNSNGKTALTVASLRQRSSSYPRFSLQQVEKLAHTVFEMGPRNCDAERVAKALRFSNAKNGSFVGLRATAAQFGLITGSKDSISVSESWIQIFLSDNSEEIQEARKLAIFKPDLYRLILDEYKNRQLPNVERLAKELHINQKYGILKDAANAAAETFEESAKYAGILDTKGFLKTESIEVENRSKTEEVDLVQNGEKNFDKDQTRVISSMIDNQMDFDPKLPKQDENGLDKLEIKLRGGKKAFLFVPVPLHRGEKERLKALIDLLLEEEDEL